MAAENYYDLLGLRKGANDEEVKQAFRELAKTLHPDRNPGDPEAERHFKLVNTAYEALKDASRRRAYDEWLAFARKHDRSRLAQWGRLAALIAVLLVGPSLALYWALVALDLAGPSRKDRAALPAIVNSQASPEPRRTPPPRQVSSERQAQSERQTSPDRQVSSEKIAAPAKTETAALPEPVAPTPPPKTELPASSAPGPADQPLAAPAPIKPAPRAEIPPLAAPDSTSSIASPAPTRPAPPPVDDRPPLRELAGADDRRDALGATPKSPPAPPAEDLATPRRTPQAVSPLPEDAESGGSARSMARALAELKEPRATQNDGLNERNQRQATLPPEEEQRSPAGRAQDVEEFSDCDRCPRMSVVVATDFAPRDAVAPPSGRQVQTSRTLAISRSEVTIAEWNACVRDGACAGFRDYGAGGGNRPVLDVSRSEALAYADWLSRKTGKLYRPLKSGGWGRSNEGGARGGAAPRYDQRDDQGFPSECENGGDWRWLNDYDCNRQARRAARNRDAGRSPPREGTDVSGFRVARSLGPNE